MVKLYHRHYELSNRDWKHLSEHGHSALPEVVLPVMYIMKCCQHHGPNPWNHCELIVLGSPDTLAYMHYTIPTKDGAQLEWLLICLHSQNLQAKQRFFYNYKKFIIIDSWKLINKEIILYIIITTIQLKQDNKIAWKTGPEESVDGKGKFNMGLECWEHSDKFVPDLVARYQLLWSWYWGWCCHVLTLFGIDDKRNVVEDQTHCNTSYDHQMGKSVSDG